MVTYRKWKKFLNKSKGIEWLESKFRQTLLYSQEGKEVLSKFPSFY